MNSQKLCKNCNIPLTNPENSFCSKSCSSKFTANDPTRLLKIKQTKLEKYGDANFNNPSKNKETSLKNDSYKSRHEKIKLSNLEKYGVESTNQLDSIKEKKKKTSLLNFGVECPLASNIIKQKAQTTKLEKYNNPTFTNPQKMKHTKEEKYGKDYTTIIMKDYYSHLSKNFNIKHFNQKHILNFKELEELDDIKIKKWVKNNRFLIIDFCNYFNICISYANIIKSKIIPNIPNKITKHKTQQEIFDYIQYEFKIMNDKKILNGKEIDIVCNNFGIEFNGLMFHSYGISASLLFDNVEQEDSKYHLYKTELCESKGIQLFHIFENEWLVPKTQKIWKSVLNNKLGLNQKIYARKTNIKEISSSIARDFCEENHLQGYSNSSIRLGLFFEDELVSVMTFGKPRYSKKYEYELIRFCTKTGLNVVGGASKLLKYFERTYNPKSIISYANRRWSQGNVYEKLGLEFSHNTEPGYFYFLEKEYKLLGRTQFQKHKLKDMLSYSEERTESEIMFLEGYRRIWDCGNKVYFKEYL